jgi:hypothetical protein
MSSIAHEFKFSPHHLASSDYLMKLRSVPMISESTHDGQYGHFTWGEDGHAFE